MSSARGIYFDGKVARGHPITLEFVEPALLRFSGEGIAQEIDLAQVRVSDRLGDVPRFLYLPGDAIIETPGNAVVDAALAARRRSRGAQLIHALESQQRIAAVACMLIVAAIVALGIYGPPLLARVVAQRVPAEIDQRIGTAALATIRRYTLPSTLTSEERSRVQKQLTRLQADARVPRARLEFYSMRGLPNAFALPGNVIIVTDELVRLPASDDELAAVLAHELGHLERRHGLQSLLRNSFALLIVAAVTGDLSALTSFAGTVPLTLLTAGYSRDLEREADRYAFELLQARGIAPRAFSSALVKLEAAHESRVRNSHYLSTHPATDERTAVFGGLSPAERQIVLAEPWLERANAASKRRDYAGAIAHYTRFLELTPTARAYALRAKCHFAANNRTDGEADVAKALALDPKSVEALALHAENLALRKRDYAGAVAAARSVLEREPDDATTLATLGYAETMTGEFEPAAAHLARAVRLAPSDYRGWAYRGVLKQRQSDFAGARKDYDEALRLQPNTPWILTGRGACRLRLGDNEGALADLVRVTDPVLQTADYFHDRALAHHGLGQATLAIADYTITLEKKGGQVTPSYVHLNRGNAYSADGNSIAALADFSTAIVLDARNGQAHLRRAATRGRLGDFESASVDLDRARELGVDELLVERERGSLRRRAGDLAGALRSYDLLLQKKPDPFAYRSRGLLHFALGDFARAESDLNECLQTLKKEPEEYAEFFLLLVRRRQKHHDQRAAFSATVAGWPNGWAKSVGRYLTGDLSETQLLAATNLGQKPTREERLCEAYFYIAESYLLQGERVLAETYYQRCVDTGVTNFSEHMIASGELKRMRRAP